MAEKKPDNVMTDVELKSFREWLGHWGEGPNWMDNTGVQIPAVKAQLEKLVNTVEHWKKRAAQHGCNVEDGDHECG